MTNKQGYQILCVLMLLWTISMGVLSFGNCTLSEWLLLFSIPLFSTIILYILSKNEE